MPFKAPGRGRQPFILLLDGILDPGNLGAILRSAAFLGVTGVAITKYNSAPLSPVAIKASASASEVLPLYSVDSTLGFLQQSKENGWMVYASVAAGPRSKGNSHVTLERVEKYDPLSQQPTILIVGSEGEGLGKQIRRAADFEVSIPGASGLLSTVDSLNVSVAAGILCSSFLKKSQDMGIDPESFVDVPEEDAFLAPVQVRELPGRGMGVIATKDIQVRRSQHIDHPLGSHDGITHIAWGAGPSREAVVCGAEQR